MTGRWAVGRAAQKGYHAPVLWCGVNAVPVDDAGLRAEPAPGRASGDGAAPKPVCAGLYLRCFCEAV